ncbi:HNH/endonuclease VII fold toxin-2 domain-containing protein [Pyxidicoccus xibeiensis]|uniref:HNH/endonuclease VII fold toxin-2 domain-containing protein n=1 Tax=Pyxidicoccus xibeiensis TaxID=2906759 RepID=UPI0020A78C76|nr:HNH/endonuclease VII fold toxin-2 domain-containing protein [Pyxidicoccus xibeiensis]MCP3145364.1 hypothetical protein [Pyxidicoccus xibeiensis]
MHTIQSAQALKQPEVEIDLVGNKKVTAKAWTYGEAKKSAVEAASTVFQQSGCSEKCMKAQLDAYHRQCGINDNTQIKAVSPNEITPEELDAALAEASARNSMALLERLMGATDSAAGWAG